MKTRVTLNLGAVQVERLRAIAERRGRSLSEVVREILAEHLDRPAGKSPNRALIKAIGGIGRSGTGDLAARHDEVLYGKRRGPRLR